MKTVKLAIILLFAVSINFAQTSWGLDKSHSKIGFSVVHLVISEVEGQFNEYDVKVTSNGDDFDGASVEFSADVNSIDTDNEKRDNHLKSDDFFNAEQFPKMTFVSTSFSKEDDKNYKLVGDLTIRDVTKEVELDVVYNGMVKDPWGNTKAGFKATGAINRFDYNLKWNAALETGGLVVGEDVNLIINLELAKQ
ncbi:MAG: YceI family protein [Ignavibacteriae bacterium]|nr:YceI family protein [Ignavibacteriota bacterium]